jgi:hypothetical protein
MYDDSRDVTQYPWRIAPQRVDWEAIRLNCKSRSTEDGAQGKAIRAEATEQGKLSVTAWQTKTETVSYDSVVIALPTWTVLTHTSLIFPSPTTKCIEHGGFIFQEANTSN